MRGMDGASGWIRCRGIAKRGVGVVLQCKRLAGESGTMKYAPIEFRWAAVEKAVGVGAGAWWGPMTARAGTAEPLGVGLGGATTFAKGDGA